MRERPLSHVPRAVWALLGAGLALQIAWSAARAPAAPAAADLPAPPPAPALSLLALGDDVLAARLAVLWLQAFDNQPGISIPFRALDYERVAAWIERALALDPRTQYPLLAASRLYAAVPDPERQRRMLDLIHDQALKDPARRWRWLAEAALVAKYRLRDRELALRYARALTEHATPEVPYWARDLSVILLADMGEWDAARELVAALLASGEISDPHELAFLEAKLAEIEGARGPDVNSEAEGGATDEISTGR